MKAAIYAALACCVLVLWALTRTNESGAARALESAGYTNVALTGYAWFACSGDDWSQTGFHALGPTGVATTGTVCCGLIWKNCTVRH